MSPANEQKSSRYRRLSLLAALALFAASCFEDRSLGVLGDAGGSGADGAPAATCAARANYDACHALSGCRWLEPGCGAPALPRPTCAALAELSCRADGDCPTGKKCLAYNINPCAGPTAPGQVTCGSCGQEERICW
jgi:hypothetical protein